jgi:hypothetical protein
VLLLMCEYQDGSDDQDGHCPDLHRNTVQCVNQGLQNCDDCPSFSPFKCLGPEVNSENLGVRAVLIDR